MYHQTSQRYRLYVRCASYVNYKSYLPTTPCSVVVCPLHDELLSHSNLQTTHPPISADDCTACPPSSYRLKVSFAMRVLCKIHIPSSLPSGSGTNNGRRRCRPSFTYILPPPNLPLALCGFRRFTVAHCAKAYHPPAAGCACEYRNNNI